MDGGGLGERCWAAPPPSPRQLNCLGDLLLLCCHNTQAALNLKLGVVSSGNSLDYTDKDMETMGQYKVAVKEMEAASIAWVCDMYKTPFICVKAITDIVDGGRCGA